MARLKDAPARPTLERSLNDLATAVANGDRRMQEQRLAEHAAALEAAYGPLVGRLRAAERERDALAAELARMSTSQLGGDPEVTVPCCGRPAREGCTVGTEQLVFGQVTAIPVGGEQPLGQAQLAREPCPDCRAQVGAWHHAHCRVRTCPQCQRSLRHCGHDAGRTPA